MLYTFNQHTYMCKEVIIFVFQINEAAFHNPRLLLDIEAGSPIILIPHSSKTSDVLVADLGKLSVKNCFIFDGDSGTFTSMAKEQVQTPGVDGKGKHDATHESLSRTSSRTSQRSVGSTSGVITSRSVSQTDTLQVGFDELLSTRVASDPMTDSIYGGLESDARNDDDIYDPTENLTDSDFRLDPTNSGTSVDTMNSGLFSRKSLSETEVGSSKSGKVSLQMPKQGGSFVDRSNSESGIISPGPGLQLLTSRSDPFQPCSPTFSVSSPSLGVPSPTGDLALTDNRNVFAGIEQFDKERKVHRCLLDVLEVNLSDMDLFSAERVEKRKYNGTNLNQDLEFPSCVIQRKVRLVSWYICTLIFFT